MSISLDELASKPLNYRFDKKESKIIKDYIVKIGIKGRYAIYTKKSKYKANIAFIIDRQTSSPRRSLVENNFEFFDERPLSKKELDSEIGNFGCENRRFTVWYYKNIDQLIAEDLKWGVKTPKHFIKKCRERGLNGEYQTRLNLE